MPIPGKEAGTLTEFDFEYFANTRIMDIGDHPLAGVLAGDESFMVRTIKP
jgi:hypothetical protein